MGKGREEEMTGGRREERGMKTKNYVHGFITNALPGPNMVLPCVCDSGGFALLCAMMIQL